MKIKNSKESLEDYINKHMKDNPLLQPMETKKYNLTEEEIAEDLKELEWLFKWGSRVGKKGYENSKSKST